MDIGGGNKACLEYTTSINTGGSESRPWVGISFSMKLLALEWESLFCTNTLFLSHQLLEGGQQMATWPPSAIILDLEFY